MSSLLAPLLGSGNIAINTTVQVVTEDEKFFDSLRFVEEKALEVENGDRISRGIKTLNRAVDKLFKNKKISPSAAQQQPWLSFQRRTSLPQVDENDCPTSDYFPNVIIYHGSDLEAFRREVIRAGPSGVFILCVNDADTMKTATKMFACYTSVDVASKEICMGDDFTYVLLSAILKRALREAGFLE